MYAYDDDYGKGYFKCPSCSNFYDFTEFHDFEHQTKADPSDREILGRAKCPNCGLEFSYYFTSDVFPILVGTEVTPPPPPIPPMAASYEEEEATPLTDPRGGWGWRFAPAVAQTPTRRCCLDSL